MYSVYCCPAGVEARLASSMRMGWVVNMDAWCIAFLQLISLFPSVIFSHIPVAGHRHVSPRPRGGIMGVCCACMQEVEHAEVVKPRGPKACAAFQSVV